MPHHAVRRFISKYLRFLLENLIHARSRAWWISFCLRGSRRERRIERLSAFNAHRPVLHLQKPCWVWISVRKARELDSSSLASLLKSTPNTAGGQHWFTPTSVCLSLSLTHTYFLSVTSTSIVLRHIPVWLMPHPSSSSIWGLLTDQRGIFLCLWHSEDGSRKVCPVTSHMNQYARMFNPFFFSRLVRPTHQNPN